MRMCPSTGGNVGATCLHRGPIITRPYQGASLSNQSVLFVGWCSCVPLVDSALLVSALALVFALAPALATPPAE